ncbi:uncharacterized protein LOC116342116 [Contarinia nasturtii]|uniref:uncharacterized protein LOC116342116 n=1 Tax=Contarinia nasturtii TaxID=265458 RepID=UPI0012D47DF6|nr:uncharacterized protein LOC116342116 [Contarinia nasturtii]
MKFFSKIGLVFMCFVSTLHASNSVDLTKCVRDIGNCERFSFRRIQQNVTSVNNSSDSKHAKSEALKDLGNIENKIVVEQSHIQENVYLENIGSKLLRLTPAFNPSRSENTSTACKIHTRQFFNALNRLDLWAFQMHDASAKIPSGILSGNINQLGDFDQCLNVMAPNNEFSGKYCLAYVQISVPDYLPNMKKLRKLVHAHDAFVNDFDDV